MGTGVVGKISPGGSFDSGLFEPRRVKLVRREIGVGFSSLIKEVYPLILRYMLVNKPASCLTVPHCHVRLTV